MLSICFAGVGIGLFLTVLIILGLVSICLGVLVRKIPNLQFIISVLYLESLMVYAVGYLLFNHIINLFDRSAYVTCSVKEDIELTITYIMVGILLVNFIRLFILRGNSLLISKKIKKIVVVIAGIIAVITIVPIVLIIRSW